MVERVNSVLPMSQQCRLLAVSRSSVYRKPAEASAEDLAFIALIDRHYLVRPYYGSRRMAAWLATQGYHVNRKRVQRLMRRLVSLWRGPAVLTCWVWAHRGTAFDYPFSDGQAWSAGRVNPQLMAESALATRVSLLGALPPRSNKASSSRQKLVSLN